MFERNITPDSVIFVVENGEVIRKYDDDTPYPSRLILGGLRSNLCMLWRLIVTMIPLSLLSMNLTLTFGMRILSPRKSSQNELHDLQKW
jgi:hypothetical protein